MFRILLVVGIFATVAMIRLYSHAAPEQRSRFPAPVKIVAEHVNEASSLSITKVTNSFLPELRSRLETLQDEIITAYVGPATLGESFYAVNEDLRHLDFTEQYHPSAVLTGANLSGVPFFRTGLSNAMMDGADFSGAAISETVIAGATARAANFAECAVFDSDFEGLSAQGANFAGSKWASTLLSGAQLSGASFDNASFTHVYLDNAIAYRTSFKSLTGTGVDFSGANLTGADFSNAMLAEANFTGALLDEVNFSGAVLTASHGLKMSQLAYACGNSETALPDGLSILNCETPSLKKPMGIDMVKLPTN